MAEKKKQDKHFGKLPPLYKFILNPYEDVRFTSCPGCGGKTRQRKLPLLIHTDPDHLISLNKTVRYCPACDLLIAHQDEIEAFLAAYFGQYAPEVVGNDYLVLGTMERKAWREGTHRPLMLAEIREAVHDFKEHRTVQPEHYGWVPADKIDEERA